MGKLRAVTDPPVKDNELTLCLRECQPADPSRAYVPSEHYDIVIGEQVVGKIDLRLGNTEPLRLYGGHVGYAVDREHRGHGYAARAIRVLARIASAAGMAELWITCSPDNIASRRTAENAGATYVETVDLPSSSDMYIEGEREKCRYLLITNR